MGPRPQPRPARFLSNHARKQAARIVIVGVIAGGLVGACIGLNLLAPVTGVALAVLVGLVVAYQIRRLRQAA